MGDKKSMNRRLFVGTLAGGGAAMALPRQAEAVDPSAYGGEMVEGVTLANPYVVELRPGDVLLIEVDYRLFPTGEDERREFEKQIADAVDWHPVHVTMGIKGMAVVRKVE